MRRSTYLRLTGRSEEQIALVEAYCREQGLFHNANTPEAEYSELLALDLARSNRASPDRSARRIASPCRMQRNPSRSIARSLIKAPKAGAPAPPTAMAICITAAS